MLTLENLHASYDHTPILSGVSLRATSGEVVGILGRNGAGKTTLLRAIFNQVPRRSGSILLNTRNVGGLPSHKIPTAGIGFVPQGRGLFEELTVGENMRLVRASSARQRLEAAVEIFPLVKQRWNQRAGTLSGGEAKQVNLARVLLLPLRVVLLDEPTGNLSVNNIGMLRQLISHWRNDEVTVLIVEHNLDFVLEVADRACVIERGRVVLDTSAEDLARNGKMKIREVFGLLPNDEGEEHVR